MNLTVVDLYATNKQKISSNLLVLISNKRYDSWGRLKPPGSNCKNSLADQVEQRFN